MNHMNEISRDGCRDAILDSLNEGVFTVDLNWLITTFNRAAERITGIRRHDAVGRLCCEVFRASVCEKACPLRQTMKTARPIVNATAHIISETGNQIPIRMSTALLKDDRGQIFGGVETFQDLTAVEQLQKELEARYTFEDIIGRSSPMQSLFRLLPQVAESHSTVLIEGESGTGKELIAQAIHNLSGRKGRFVAVNCGALPDSLLESELFGYKAGAFTDARTDKPGRFALADGGTILLDEIGDVSAAMQIRLLRVLQEQVVEPLGSVHPLTVNVRVLAATNRDLTRLMKAGTFREDLFYRICVVRLKLPSLRERREDIPLLVNHLIGKFNRLRGKDIAGISDDVLARLMDYDYPGNVRELENIIEHAFVLCRGGLIELHHLPPEMRPADPELHRTHPTSLAAMEKLLIVEALHRNKGNRKRAARDLGIDASTLYRKAKALDIDLPALRGQNARPRSA